VSEDRPLDRCPEIYVTEPPPWVWYTPVCTVVKRHGVELVKQTPVPLFTSN
jgi:hypothetical protein